MATTLLLFSISLTLTIASLSSSSKAGLILEDGYTVTTVIDGHKLNINPYLIHPLRQSSDLVILNYAAGVFYTAAFPTSFMEEVALKPLAGDGKVGFSDGELGSAQFNKPKNFAVDVKGNVYVADKGNHAIRKISSSGVTTIAGGSSNKEGKEDGPAQNATFSSDFDLVFVAGQCALLVADHGNQLVRQIALKSEDCTTESPASPSELQFFFCQLVEMLFTVCEIMCKFVCDIQSFTGLGAAPWWILGLGLSCILGIAVGLVIRPYVIPHQSERPNPFWFSKTWNLWLIKLVKEARTLCFDIRSGVASLHLYTLLRRLLLMCLSHVSLMFRINPVGSQAPIPRKDFVSLIDSDMCSTSSNPAKSDAFANQLSDLMTSDIDLLSSNPDAEHFKLGDAYQSMTVSSSDVRGRIDNMIEASVTGFDFAAKEPPSQLEGSVPVDLGLLRRR
ncbi:hypothetical protein LINPERHAP1_LOCUS27889 [Linum perenne]